MLLCRHFLAQQCQSCSLLGEAYESTVTARMSCLTNMFPDVAPLPLIRCNVIPGSRIRAKLAITGTLDQPVVGFFDQDRRVVQIDDCPLHHPLIGSWIPSLHEFIRKSRLVPYDPLSDRGELKFVVLTASPSHQQLMVQWVLRSRESVDRILRTWRDDHHELRPAAIMSITVQPRRSSQIQGLLELRVSEATYLPVAFGGLELEFGAASFIQTNHEVASLLYQTAGEWLREAPNGHVVDLYCGVGPFALTAALAGHRVQGIDVSEDAIDCARRAASRMQVNAEFLCQSLTQAPQMNGRPDIAICNPPRRGLDSAALAFLQETAPKSILYSSCDPDSLHRDVGRLASQWNLVRIQGFDMFPFTRHMEVLALLKRRDIR